MENNEVKTLDLDMLEEDAKAAPNQRWHVVGVGDLYGLGGEPLLVIDQMECPCIDDAFNAQHVGNMDPETTLAIIRELREERAKVQRVRDIHKPTDSFGETVCENCQDMTGGLWPCSTIRALEGEGE